MMYRLKAGELEELKEIASLMQNLVIGIPRVDNWRAAEWVGNLDAARSIVRGLIEVQEKYYGQS